ncbi:MAG: hypothetical protein ACO35E_03965 [Ilumatobacteraceae bacterium]
MTRRRVLLPTLALVLVVVTAAVLADRSVVRVGELRVGDCFLYDRDELVSGVETLDCDDALAAAGDPSGPVAALVVWRGGIEADGANTADAADVVCEPFRVSSPVVVPLVRARPTSDGTLVLCLAIGR